MAEEAKEEVKTETKTEQQPAVAQAPATEPQATPAPSTTTTTTTTAAPKKSGNKALVVIAIIIGVLVVLGLAGNYVWGHYIAKKIGESAAETILSNAIGGKVDVSTGSNGATVTTKDGTVSTGDKASWPADMPNSVPKVSSGTITYAAKNASDDYTYWSVIYDKGTADTVTKYKADLVAGGWTVTSEVNASYINSITATKAKLETSYSVDPSTSGGTLTVTQTNT